MKAKDIKVDRLVTALSSRGRPAHPILHLRWNDDIPTRFAPPHQGASAR
jgi:hypothetical protein